MKPGKVAFFVAAGAVTAFGFWATYAAARFGRRSSLSRGGGWNAGHWLDGMAASWDLREPSAQAAAEKYIDRTTSPDLRAHYSLGLPQYLRDDVVRFEILVDGAPAGNPIFVDTWPR